jgi:hypothetical protein
LPLPLVLCFFRAQNMRLPPCFTPKRCMHSLFPLSWLCYALLQFLLAFFSATQLWFPHETYAEEPSLEYYTRRSCSC